MIYRKVTMLIPADGLADKILSNTETLGQIPDLCAAFVRGGLQSVQGKELLDFPLVGPFSCFFFTSQAAQRL